MNKNILEELLIVLACTALLWVGIGDIWGHNINHPFPYSYLATDPFQHQTRAQWIKDTGHYRFEAPYYSGGLTDVVGFYPPVLNHLSVIMSYLSGNEVHDAILLLPFLFAITGMLLLYTLARNIHKAYAVLCIPFVSYIFYTKETLVAFFWGHWPALSGDLFLFFTTAAILNNHKKHWWPVIALLLIGTVMTHTAGFIFALLFLCAWIAYTTLFQTAQRPQFKYIIFTLIFVFLVTFPFLNLFRQSWMIQHPFKLEPITDWSGGGGYLKLTHFTSATYLLGIGILIALFLAKKQPLLFLSLFFLFAGLTNYIGFTIRAFNLRFFWPITLAPLFALPLFLIIKKTGTKAFLVATLLALLLFSGITYANYKKTPNQSGLMNTHIWETLQWIKKNTPQNATLYVGYGDYYDQDAGLANAQRVFTRTETEDFVPLFHNKTLNRYIPTKLFVEAGAGLPYKIKPFQYKLHYYENRSIADNHYVRDICAYDYYLFDRISQYPELITYSLSYAEAMLNTPHFELVHQNPWSIVLHNKKPGDDCLGTP